MRWIATLLTLFMGSPILLGNGKVLAGVATDQAIVQPDMILVTHGDSMTRDLDVANYSYVLKALIATGQGLNVRMVNRGINGISYNYRWGGEPYLETLNTDAPIAVDPLRSATIPSWLIVFAGTNGISLQQVSGTAEYGNFKTYVAARIAAGWVADRIVACTMLPRQTDIFETYRGQLNTGLGGDDGGYGYRVARLDLNANIGGAGDNDNTDYFYDAIHPTAAGHVIIAQVIYDTMFP